MALVVVENTICRPVTNLKLLALWNLVAKFALMMGWTRMYRTVSEITLFVLSEHLRPYSCMDMFVSCHVLEFELDNLRKATTRRLRHFDGCKVAGGNFERRVSLDNDRVYSQMTAVLAVSSYR